MAPPPLKSWRVLTRNQLTHDVFELKLKRPDDQPSPLGAARSHDQPSPVGEGYKLNFRAGQYISIVVPGAGPGGRNLRRAYSIASAPESDEIELCVKLVDGGPGTNYLNSLKAGSEFQGQAPFGDFCLEHDQTLPTLFIGTGTGLAPLRSMVLSSEWKGGGPVGFLLGVRAEKDVIYPELFGPDRFPALRGQEHVRVAVSRPEGDWPGFRGRVTDYIRQMDWDFGRGHYYLCGNGAMITEVKDFLATRGVTKERIHTEKYY